MTNTQLCDHYINLIYQLNSYAVRISLETNMTINKVPYGDVEQTLIAITQVLTALLISDECIAMEAEGDSAGRALAASRDPRKTPKPPGAQGSQPKEACRFCGRMHWSNKCFKNPRADLETQKKAAEIAPSSPAARTFLKTNPDPSADKPTAVVKTVKPSAGDEKKGDGGAAKVAAAEDDDNKVNDDLITQSLDASQPTSIIIGRGCFARMQDEPVSELRSDSERSDDDDDNEPEHRAEIAIGAALANVCLLYTSPSPRD